MHIVLKYLEIAYSVGLFDISLSIKLGGVLSVSWLGVGLTVLPKLLNYTTGTFRNKAILGIPIVLALERSVGLPLLHLLPTTRNPLSSASLRKSLGIVSLLCVLLNRLKDLNLTSCVLYTTLACSSSVAYARQCLLST